MSPGRSLSSGGFVGAPERVQERYLADSKTRPTTCHQGISISGRTAFPGSTACMSSPTRPCTASVRSIIATLPTMAPGGTREAPHPRLSADISSPFCPKIFDASWATAEAQRQPRASNQIVIFENVNKCVVQYGRKKKRRKKPSKDEIIFPAEFCAPVVWILLSA